MSLYLILKLLHIVSVIGMIAGLIGRNIVKARTAKVSDIQIMQAFVELGGRFERYLLIPGSLFVLLTGLLLAWAGRWSFQDGGYPNWLLVSLLLFLSTIPLIPCIFVPRGKHFDLAYQDALMQKCITPLVQAALSDKVVFAAYVYELVAFSLVIILMVTKPF